MIHNAWGADSIPVDCGRVSVLVWCPVNTFTQTGAIVPLNGAPSILLDDHGWETLAMLLIGGGALRLWRARSTGAAQFNRAKGLAIVGLTVSLLQWYFAFLVVGGEWFLMWQSEVFNGQPAAHRMFSVLGISLIFLAMKDGEADA